MAQDSAMKEVLGGIDISNRQRKERLESDMVGEIYYLVNSAERNETAAEMEASMKLEEAAEKGMPTNKIIDLACECSAEAKEAGFKQGFHTAMKLCMEGLRGGVF